MPQGRSQYFLLGTSVLPRSDGVLDLLRTKLIKFRERKPSLFPIWFVIIKKAGVYIKKVRGYINRQKYLKVLKTIIVFTLPYIIHENINNVNNFTNQEQQKQQNKLKTCLIRYYKCNCRLTKLLEWINKHLVYDCFTSYGSFGRTIPVSYTHLDVYKRQG